jgi:hypothetical protein
MGALAPFSRRGRVRTHKLRGCQRRFSQNIVVFSFAANSGAIGKEEKAARCSENAVRQDLAENRLSMDKFLKTRNFPPNWRRAVYGS